MRKRLTLVLSGMVCACAVIATLSVWQSSPQTHPLLAPPPKESAPPVEGLTAYWQRQADAAESAGQTEVAADYRARIDAYTRSAAAAGAGLVAPGTEVPRAGFELYVRKEADATSNTAARAKHEPEAGVYLGMLGADRRVSYDVTKIEQVYGRKHALFLSYVGWRKVQADTNTYFPQTTANRVKALGGALQIGWEPRYGLDDVQDDEYVRRFAREAKASGIPVFLRYASEMNGAWVPWHGDPQKYIEKFRLIHDIMAEEAPNVAMVWSPNFAPTNNIDEYYPGDAYVDWVGFSLYATPLASGQEDLNVSLIDAFTPLYAKYSHKPIMISEGAVAHSVLSTDKTYWRWAENQFTTMYGILPRMFPQVKAVTYFNFSRAQAVRSKMDFVYDLGENPYTNALYQRLTASDWFLSEPDPNIAPPPYRYDKAASWRLPAGRHTALVYAPLPNGDQPFAIALFQGGKRLGVSYEAPWEIPVQLSAAQAAEPLVAAAYNVKLEPIAVNSP